MTAEQIKRLRKRHGMTQTEFAKFVGVTFVTVNRWERGRNGPQPDRLHRLMQLKRGPMFLPMQLVKAKAAPRKWRYPWKKGDHLLHLGEIIGMPGHVAVVDEKGRVHWGYHDDGFVALTNEEI